MAWLNISFEEYIEVPRPFHNPGVSRIALWFFCFKDDLGKAAHIEIKVVETRLWP